MELHCYIYFQYVETNNKTEGRLKRLEIKLPSSISKKVKLLLTKYTQTLFLHWTRDLNLQSKFSYTRAHFCTTTWTWNHDFHTHKTFFFLPSEKKMFMYNNVRKINTTSKEIIFYFSFFQWSKRIWFIKYVVDKIQDICPELALIWQPILHANVAKLLLVKLTL